MASQDEGAEYAQMYKVLVRRAAAGLNHKELKRVALSER